VGAAAKEAVERYDVLQGERRLLNHRLLELKGAIRVFLRIRPPSDRERTAGVALQARSQLDATLEVPAPEAKSQKGGKPGAPSVRSYEFDHVAAPRVTQAELYEEVEPLVRSALDGYNVCIFAYGQTGSGKTHTMEGSEGDRGVAPRALSGMFRLAEESWAGVAFEFSVSVLEVYNDRIRDLLDQDPKNPKGHEVRKGVDGRWYVSELEHAPVAGAMDVMRLLRRAAGNRKTGRTDMNAHSSRSHLVLTVTVRATAAATGAVTVSRLNLVDLAGSERLSRTGAEGDRLKEAQHINKSLSCLGNCMSALARRSKGKDGKAAHVPYRDCKLTHLLADSLGGDSKTLMFVCCSPAASEASETQCSLDFASRVRSVELGHAVARQQAAAAPASSDEALREANDKVRALQADVKELTDKLARAEAAGRAPSPFKPGALPAARLVR